MSVAAPPLSEMMTIGDERRIELSTVSSVFGPPATTSSTIGTCSCCAKICSNDVRSSISDPHALTPVCAPSTSTKWVWPALSRAPSAELSPRSVDSRYSAVGPAEW